MNANEPVVIHTDGAARGNPGPAAYSFILSQPGQSDIEEKAYLGETTNNVAEYMALIKSLAKAKALGIRKAIVNSDSELMIKQMRGEYKVRNAGLMDLYQEADALRRSFQSVEFRHVRREANKRADQLCNQALDAALGKKPGGGATAKPKKKGAAVQDQVRGEMQACLDACIAAWKQGDPQAPAAREILEQIWSILEEAGMVGPANQGAT
jgi:ribonuclease HI